MSIAINESHIKQGMNYPEYLALIEQLLSGDKTTSGDHSPGMIGATRLNVQRMARLDKKLKLSEETLETLQALEIPLYWVVFTEAWCGDAAQNIPVFAKMAEASENIELKLLLRDEHPEVMDSFLSENRKAIPKLVCLRQENLEVLGTWGPRPAPAQELMKSFNPIQTQEEFIHMIHSWYNKDKGKVVQKELMNIVNTINIEHSVNI